MPARNELANAIRFLSMDAVQKANSGHPGAPMGMADMAEVLWNDFLRHNPGNPGWDNRDRFVLSNGHASMLIYSMLHLTGYELSLDEIKNFRQFGSLTPGHPECDVTPGVENTSGPLGQGICNGVGMALAEKMLAETFNRDGFPIVDHNTYVFMGDGCLMEGVTQEAASLAGTLGLGKLVVLYDDNGISIDGPVDGWFRDDTPARFEALGWHVIRNVDGHDGEAVKAAIKQARAETGKPTLICCKTIIGFGSPAKAGTSSCHGSPLGDEEIALVREKLGWKHPAFEIPQDIYDAFDARAKGAEAEAAWHELLDGYRKEYPELAAEYERRMKGEFPADYAATITSTMEAKRVDETTLATRKSSLAALDTFSQLLPELVGGSADLAGSNGVKWSGKKDVSSSDFTGNYINFGVREFGMGAISNGMALHGGFIPYAATFMVFSDYARNSIRMASIMEQRVIWILTHDSIGVGEDGPTHQPVEHVPSLRLIPGVNVWRPCDTFETYAAWKSAVENDHGPSALSLTRQGLPQMKRDKATAADVARGGYVLCDCEGTPQAIIIATGSEVGIAMEACTALNGKGVRTRLVSMPCEDIFAAQDQAYKDKVLPPSVTARVAVEAGQPDLWYKYVGLGGEVIGMQGFGKSAPGAKLFEYFGFTAANIVDKVEASLKRS